eukprot:COSAG01_NODE_3900_length_5564_cov_6.249405_6_plen_35_part_00
MTCLGYSLMSVLVPYFSPYFTLLKVIRREPEGAV